MKSKIPYFIVGAMVICFALAIVLSDLSEKKRIEPYREDMERFATEEYDVAFLSNFSVDYYEEADYEIYRGMDIVISHESIRDSKVLKAYLKEIEKKNNSLSTLYLGVDPAVLSGRDVMKIARENKDTHLEIILAYPGIDYWMGLEEDEAQKQMESYETLITDCLRYNEKRVQRINFKNRVKNFIKRKLRMNSEETEEVAVMDQISVYFYCDQEWLLANANNYESDFGVNKDISFLLSMTSDSIHDCFVTQDNYIQMMEEFKVIVNKYREQSFDEDYPNLEQWDVVFFGDSITAFTESSSIPNAFNNFTGAKVYNCAQGGATATEKEGKIPGVVSVVDAFVAGDVTRYPKDEGLIRGIETYTECRDASRNMGIVLNFGMNDFFEEMPIENEDNPMDEFTYKGALRTAIDHLRKAYPNAKIVIMTPNYAAFNPYTREDESTLERPLSAYMEAAKEISEEYNLPFYDSFHEMDINDENYNEYLLDGCHPNERTRFMMADGLAKTFRQICYRDKAITL